MNRVSIVKQDKVENKNLRKDYRYCLVWMLIGILCGGIPLATIVSLYIKDSSKNSKLYRTIKSFPYESLFIILKSLNIIITG